MEIVITIAVVIIVLAAIGFAVQYFVARKVINKGKKMAGSLLDGDIREAIDEL